VTDELAKDLIYGVDCGQLVTVVAKARHGARVFVVIGFIHFESGIDEY